MNAERMTGQRKRLKKRLLLLLLDAVLLIALAFALIKLVSIFAGYRRAEKQYDALAAEAVTVETPAPAEPTSAPEVAEETPEPAQSPSEVPITVDFKPLWKKNKETAAWLYAEDTPINYPVMQRDDNQYYLERGFDRKKNKGGALYFDFRNDLKTPDRNLIIYGHRMKDDSMFGTLPEYEKAEYLAAHPTMYLITEFQKYRVEIFACRTVRATNLQYFETSFGSDESFAAYLEKAVSQSYWAPPFPVDTTYPIVTLVTCSTYSHRDDPRLLVHGRLIPVD